MYVVSVVVIWHKTSVEHNLFHIGPALNEESIIGPTLNGTTWSAQAMRMKRRATKNIKKTKTCPANMGKTKPIRSD